MVRNASPQWRMALRNTLADAAAETAPRIFACLISKNDGKPDRRAIPRSVSDRFAESRTEITNFRTTFSKARRKFTISGPLWQKLFRNWKSRTEFEKAGRNCEKPDGNCKFPDGNSQFPDRILYFRPAFAKVVRNLKKSADFRKSRATLAKVRRKS